MKQNKESIKEGCDELLSAIYDGISLILSGLVVAAMLAIIGLILEIFAEYFGV